MQGYRLCVFGYFGTVTFVDSTRRPVFARAAPYTFDNPGVTS